MQELLIGNMNLFITAAGLSVLAGVVAGVLAYVLRDSKFPRLTKCLVLLPLVLVVIAIYAFAANIPYDDDFNTIVAYAAHPWPSRLLHLVDYNWEHRVLLTNLCTELMLWVPGCLNFKVLMVVGVLPLAIVSWCFVRCLHDVEGGGMWALAIMFCLFSVYSDYVFWPMASIQNNGVLCLGMLAILGAKRGDRVGWLFAVCCAVMATFTSGGGMLVWPCLVAMTWFDSNCHRRRQVLMTMVGIAGFCIWCYFLIPGVPQKHDIPFSFWRAAGYFLTFVGGWCCLPGISILAGVCMCALFVFCLCRFRHLKHPEVFMFACYILMTMAAGALFRSDRIINALPPRHTELSFALMGCTIILFADEIAVSTRTLRYTSVVCLSLAVALNVFAFYFFGSIWHDRLEIDRRNLLIRPITVETLTSIHGPWHSEAVRNLSVLEKSGIYDSRWTLKPNEIIPEQRIDPGDFWTPGRRHGEPRQP